MMQIETLTVQEQLDYCENGLMLPPYHLWDEAVQDFILQRHKAGSLLLASDLRKYITAGELRLERDSRWKFRLTIPKESEA